MTRLHVLLTGLNMVSKVKPAHWSITSNCMTAILAMLSRRKSDRSFTTCLQSCCLNNIFLKSSNFNGRTKCICLYNLGNRFFFLNFLAYLSGLVV